MGDQGREGSHTHASVGDGPGVARGDAEADLCNIDLLQEDAGGHPMQVCRRRRHLPHRRPHRCANVHNAAHSWRFYIFSTINENEPLY